MITLDKLKIYKRYKGDGDMFGLAGRPVERQIVNDADWILIDTLLQDVIVIDRKLGSESRVAEAEQRLRETCADDEVIEEIRCLAKKLPA